MPRTVSRKVCMYLLRMVWLSSRIPGDFVVILSTRTWQILHTVYFPITYISSTIRLKVSHWPNGRTAGFIFKTCCTILLCFRCYSELDSLWHSNLCHPACQTGTVFPGLTWLKSAGCSQGGHGPAPIQALCVWAEWCWHSCPDANTGCFWLEKTS